MRKDKVAKIVKWVAVWCTVLAVMYLIGYIIALNYQTRTSILQAMEANQTATIEIHSPFMTMDFIKKVVQQHNKEAKKGDCYSVYLMTEESCWISSPNSFRKSAAGFRLDLVHSSFAIEEGTAVRREISFTYATTEQEEVFHESIEFWKEFVEERRICK